MSAGVDHPDVTPAEARNSIDRTRGHLENAGEEIVWQIRNRVWEVLGYNDWDEMRVAEYGGAAVIVPRASRPELVAALHSEGLSQQQIGDTLGVTHQTISNDVAKIGNVSPTRTDSLGRQQPTTRHPSQLPPRAEVEPDIEADQISIDEALAEPVVQVAPPASEPPPRNPVGDAIAEAKARPASLGAAAITYLEKAHREIVRAGGPEAICADNDGPLSEWSGELWIDTLDRVADLVAEWRKALRPHHLRSIK